MGPRRGVLEMTLPRSLSDFIADTVGPLDSYSVVPPNELFSRIKNREDKRYHGAYYNEWLNEAEQINAMLPFFGPSSYEKDLIIGNAPGAAGSHFSMETIARINRAPIENVKKYWPLICAEADRTGHSSKFEVIALLATMAVEVTSFTPGKENIANVAKHGYEGRVDLGNTQPGDGAKFRGRGFTQLSGRSNYTFYGKLLGIDLVNNPDLAMDPDTAVKIFFAFNERRDFFTHAKQKNWTQVRKDTGGTNEKGFLKVVDLYLAES